MFIIIVLLNYVDGYLNEDWWWWWWWWWYDDNDDDDCDYDNDCDYSGVDIMKKSDDNYDCVMI